MHNHSLDTSIFYLEDFTFTAPGAGNDFDFDANTLRRVEILALSCTLTTDANAANRRLKLFISEGFRTLYSTITAVDHPASHAWEYSFALGVQPIDESTNHDFILTPLPTSMFLTRGNRLNIDIENKQVGDALTVIDVIWKVWATSTTP